MVSSLFLINYYRVLHKTCSGQPVLTEDIVEFFYMCKCVNMLFCPICFVCVCKITFKEVCNILCNLLVHAGQTLAGYGDLEMQFYFLKTM